MKRRKKAEGGSWKSLFVSRIKKRADGSFAAFGSDGEFLGYFDSLEEAAKAVPTDESIANFWKETPE